MCRCCVQQKSDADYDDDDDDGESFVELSSLQDHRSVVFSVFFPFFASSFSSSKKNMCDL